MFWLTFDYILILQNYLSLSNNKKNMAKVKITKPSATVAKKDNTMVARNKPSAVMGDKPNFSGLPKNATKQDSTAYAYGFRKQVLKDQAAKKAVSTPLYGFLSNNSPFDSKTTSRIESGAMEANVRRIVSPETLKSLTRDSTMPLAPTQFPE